MIAPIITSSPESTSKLPVVRIAEPTVTSSSAFTVADTTLKAPVVTLSPASILKTPVPTKLTALKLISLSATTVVSIALIVPVTSTLPPASTFKLPTPVAILFKVTVAKVTFLSASTST